MRPFYRFILALAQIILRFSGGVRAFGTEHIPKSGSFLICSNHSTALDPPAMAVSFGREIGFMAKKELYANPFFGWVILKLNAIPIDRTRLGKDTIVAIKNLLKTGVPVLVFPEGTRSRTGRLGPGKVGIGFLAREAGVPLLPAYLHNIRRWPRTWKRQNRMAVHFGPVIEPEWITGFPAGKKSYQKIVDNIMESIRTLEQAAVNAGGTAVAKIGAGIETPPQAVEKTTICPNGQI